MLYVYHLLGTQIHRLNTHMLRDMYLIHTRS